MKFDIVAIVYATFFLFTSAQGALALAGFGNIALDPANYAQSVITVVRLLEQTNYQVWPLTGQSQMLISQSRNLINQQNLFAISPKLFANQIETLPQNVDGPAYPNPSTSDDAVLRSNGAASSATLRDCRAREDGEEMGEVSRGGIFGNIIDGSNSSNGNAAGYFFGLYDGPGTDNLKPFFAIVHVIKTHHTYHYRIEILMFGRDGWVWLDLGANKEGFGQ